MFTFTSLLTWEEIITNITVHFLNYKSSFLIDNFSFMNSKRHIKLQPWTSNCRLSWHWNPLPLNNFVRVHQAVMVNVNSAAKLIDRRRVEVYSFIVQGCLNFLNFRSLHYTLKNKSHYALIQEWSSENLTSDCLKLYLTSWKIKLNLDLFQ